MSEDVAALRAMLVDDDPHILKLLARMLSKLHLTQVVACESGAQALESIATDSAAVDLIFLDLNMPGMDGVQFIRRLAEHHFKGGVVLVSGEDGRMLDGVERLLQAHHLRCLGHLHKPVRLEHLDSLLSGLALEGGTGRFARPPRPDLDADELRQAIAQRQIVNHYQPMVSFAGGQLVGVEALVRLQPPSGPLIYPDRFIHAAEEYGLVGELTRAVLQAAVSQARQWRDAGFKTRISVNVSMNDLLSLDFPDVAAELATAAGVGPSTLTFEVTESRVMQQAPTVLDVLNRLRLKRFRLAIDDFGTGHSSLAQLRDLPFDELKIDRGFVHGASSNPTLRAICTASLRMAQQLDMESVAEGIEKVEDMELLSALGCDTAQGYLIGRPMPAAQILDWWRGWGAGHPAHAPGSA
ncbi:MAG TPA: EAL domain-containing response regulator [Steroidobacteraceae bacterium]|nr:EAL domain-containing response regulator [Steroidobacteraceae bacterium]